MIRLINRSKKVHLRALLFFAFVGITVPGLGAICSGSRLADTKVF